jgi:hypothetical protein
VSLVALGATSLACASIAGSDTGVGSGGPGVGPGDTTGGDVAVDDIEILPDALDFGALRCGSENATPQVVTIRNKSASPTSYAVNIPAGVARRPEGALTGTVPARGAVTVSLFGKPTQTGAQATDVIVTAGPAFKSLHVVMTGTGPTLTVTPSEAIFGDVRKTQGGTLPVELKNGGSEPLVVTSFGASPDFKVTWPGAPSALRVDPGAVATVQVQLVGADSESGPLTATFTPVVEGAVCGALPTLKASGARKNLDVTIGTADFDKQPCSSSPSVTKDIVITNYSPSPVTAKATLGSPSAFALAGPDIVKIGAGSDATPASAGISLKLNPTGATVGPVVEDVTVTITGDSLQPPTSGDRTTQARVDVHGAILSVTPASLNLSCDCGNRGCDTDRKGFSVKNDGNDTVWLGWKFQGNNGGYQASAPFVLAPSMSGGGTVYFSAHNDDDAKLLVDSVTGTTACTALPSLDLHGRGGN